MDIYQLTDLGERLAHNINGNNEKWRVIYFLSKRGQATKQQILENVPDATGLTLYQLRQKRIIEMVGRRVAV